MDIQKLIWTCCVLLSVLAPTYGLFSGCFPAPLTIEPTICMGCQSSNISVTWPTPDGSETQVGWLPMRFSYNERQYGVTLQAVDSQGKKQTLLLSTLLFRIIDVGDIRGANVSAAGVDEFFYWPITMLNEFVPPKTFYNTTCWSMESKDL
jgi:hypothetical protein